MSKDLQNFGAVLYVLAELCDFPNVEEEQTHHPEFYRLPDGYIKQLIITLLNLQTAQQLLDKSEIKERIKIWQEIQTNQSSSINSQQEQYSKFRSFLAQLLVEIAGASIEQKVIIAQRGVFIELSNILKWARQQNRNIALHLQEWVCEVVESLICEYTYNVDLGIESGIVSDLQQLLSKDLDLEDVKFVHANALKQFTFYSSIKHRELLFEMGVSQSVLRNIKSQIVGVEEKSVVTITNLFIYRMNMYNSIEPHPYYSVCQRDGIIDALFYDGLLNGKGDKTKAIGTYGIVWLYNGKQLPEEMRPVIIRLLKTGMLSQDDIISINSSNTLNNLAQNISNHTEIMKDDYLGLVNQIISNNESHCLSSLLKQIRIIFTIGTQQTREVLRQQLVISKIKEMTHHSNSNVIKNAFLLLSWLFNRDEMTKFDQYKKQVKEKKSGQQININHIEIIKQCRIIIREGISNIDKKGGLIYFAFRVAQSLLSDHKEIVEQEFGEDGLIYLLFQFYQTIPPEQLIKGFTFILVYLLDSVTEEQLLRMKHEKYIAPLIRILGCKDENSLLYITLLIGNIVTKMKDNGHIQQQNDIYNFFEQSGGLVKIEEIFKNQSFKRKDINQLAAIIIGSLHKSVKIPDEFRASVIDSLKQMAQDEDEKIVNLSALALAWLAECPDNHYDILSGNFSSTLKKFISGTYQQQVENGMILALNLLKFGLVESKEKVKEGVQWDIVREYAYQDDENESYILAAKLLNEWLVFIS
ncbi:MAG: hypothetical protein EZS28_016909 [Streblomastix strix]|uniref:Uncharacterized protein n=1 Tax=Streblomastix strix TaxID=222440 RepID=A0A5J4VY31_9EUKA|nr:MAG: hypothetical protein EZS28_016909 [Streblomastix strix]